MLILNDMEISDVIRILFQWKKNHNKEIIKIKIFFQGVLKSTTEPQKMFFPFISLAKLATRSTFLRLFLFHQMNLFY